jgi:predicted SpoU family rRNA methylase
MKVKPENRIVVHVVGGCSFTVATQKQAEEAIKRWRRRGYCVNLSLPRT